MPASTRTDRPSRQLAPVVLATLIIAACGDGGTAPDGVSALAIVTAPGGAVIGVPFTTHPILELRSATGQAVPVAGVEVKATLVGGTLGGTTTVETDAHGHATFSNLVVEGEEGNAELRFSCCGLSAAVVQLALSRGEISMQRVSPSMMTGRAGTALVPGPSVRLIDERGQPLAGATVAFILDGPGQLPVSSVVTDAQGVAELPSFALHDLPGPSVLTAVAVAAGKATTFDIVATTSGNAVFVTGTFDGVHPVGQTITLPPVRVTDPGPVAGAVVRYRVASGNGVLSTATATTLANGETPPVTLTTTGRGGTTVEAFTPGYVAQGQQLWTFAVVPPASFVCAAGCTATDFTWTSTTHAEILIQVVDGGGPAQEFPVKVTEVQEAGRLYQELNEGWIYDVPSGASTITSAGGTLRLLWEVPAAAGAYTISLSSPWIASPWVITATRP